MTDPLDQRIEALRALVDSPADPGQHAFATLAELLRRAGRFEEAASVLEEGLPGAPDFASGHVVDGLVRRDAGDSRGSLAAFERVLGLDPDNALALEHLARTRRGTGSVSEALELARRWVISEPWNPSAAALVATLEREEAADPPPSADEAPDPVERDDGLDPFHRPPFALDDEEPVPSASPPTLEPGPGQPGGRDGGLTLEDGATDELDGVEWAREQGRVELPPAQGDEVDTLSMADVYASQGLIDRAVGIYRRLLGRRPDDEEIRGRLRALGELDTQEMAPTVHVGEVAGAPVPAADLAPEVVPVADLSPEARTVPELAPDPVPVSELGPDPVDAAELGPDPVPVSELGPAAVPVAELGPPGRPGEDPVTDPDAEPDGGAEPDDDDDEFRSWLESLKSR